MKNRWKYIQNINSVFPDEDYDFSEEEEVFIDPKKIISLSRPFEEIYNTEQTDNLRKRIIDQGYRMNPTSLAGYVNLFEDEKGNLYVGCNGNHRSILSFELNIPKIPALVSKIKKKRKRLK